jgi:hypothetical protein
VAPAAVATATPVGPPPAQVSACRKAVTALESGDLSGVKGLSAEQRKDLVQSAAAEPAFTCVAVAQASTKACDSLESKAQQSCAEQSQIAGALKSAAPNAVKARLFGVMCSHTDRTNTDCERLDQAIASGNAGQCPAGSDPPFNLCPALAANDPAKCPQGDPALRDVCAAFVTEDSSRCPKDAGDCVKIVGDLKAVKTEGLGSAKVSNPAMAGAKGIKGCAPLIAALKDTCSGPGGSTDSSPQPVESPEATPGTP